MTTGQLRRQIKKSLDGFPAERLPVLAEYIAFLSRPTVCQRLARAKRDLAAGKGVNWRTVRRTA